MEGTMSDRTLSNPVPPPPWTWLGRATRSTTGAALGRNAPWSGAPDLGSASRPGTPPPRGWRATLRAAWHRHRTRRCLAELDAYLLKDIGISHAEAEAEANKPFWAR
jgi:uncharacterized protein YjiS (DUF1127 family)